MVVLLELGLGGTATVVVTAAAAIAGYAAHWRTVKATPAQERLVALRGWLPATAAAGGGFLLAMAPLIGSGRAGVLGYILNDDPVGHSALIELFRADGLHRDGAYDRVIVDGGGRARRSRLPAGEPRVADVLRGGVVARHVLRVDAVGGRRGCDVVPGRVRSAAPDVAGGVARGARRRTRPGRLSLLLLPRAGQLEGGDDRRRGLRGDRRRRRRVRPGSPPPRCSARDAPFAAFLTFGAGAGVGWPFPRSCSL